MRYIVIFLLWVNVGYFAWICFGSEQNPQPVPLVSRPLLNSGLTLVSEYEQQLATQIKIRCFSIANFNTIDDAASFIAEIDENRFDASLNLSTGEIQVWLQALESDVLENPAWLELTVDRPDLTVTENLCETIAQGVQFP